MFLKLRMQQAAEVGSRRTAGAQSDEEMLRFGCPDLAISRGELPKQTDRQTDMVWVCRCLQ